MSKGLRVKGLIDGHLREVRLHSPVEASTVERLISLTAAPHGGTYVIHHPPTDLEGRDFYDEFKSRNPGMKAYIGYTTFETDSIPEPWVESCNSMDEIWVPSHFNVNTFSSAGVDRRKLHVIPHGFDPLNYQPDQTEPLKIGSAESFDFLSIFEWTYRKGWDVLIRAYIEEFDQKEKVRLILRTYQGGGVIGEKAPPIVDQLGEYIRGLGHDPEAIPDIEILDKIVPAQLMPNLYRSADAFVLPTRGEGWGIPLTESMLMETPVIATRWSAQQEFMKDENSYLIDVDAIVPVSADQVRDNPLYEGHNWAEPSLKHTKKLMRHVFEHRDELNEKGRQARDYILNNFTIHHVAARISDRLIDIERKIKASKPKRGRRHDLKILFQARPSIFTLPGGDTDVLGKLRGIFENEGIHVDFSEDNAIPLKEYDLVHIFNFDTPFALNAVCQNRPYVVTPMYEDLRRYYLKSLKTVSIFSSYLQGLDNDLMSRELGLLARDDNYGNSAGEYHFIASNAQALFVSGETEKYRLRRDFPLAGSIDVVPLGFNRPTEDTAATDDLFYRTYGIRDFVLCVGRLETRKNQLMLLHALKDDDVPLVFVNSKSIQPDYEQLCTRFPRKGKTLFTGRVSKEMLFSAFKAAKVHALPSWYELPGLVSLEAAWWGCNVVASDWGTIRDYLGDEAYYCRPDSSDSIQTAVHSALASQGKPSFRDCVEPFTWEKEAEMVLKHYDRVIAAFKSPKGIRQRSERMENAKREMAFHKLRGKADMLSKDSPEEAIRLIQDLHAFRRNDPVLYFIEGSSCLTIGQFERAEALLRRAIDIRPYFHVKCYLYLSIVLISQKKYQEALSVLHDGLKVHPFMSEEAMAIMYEYMTKAYRGMGNETMASDQRIEYLLDGQGCIHEA